MPRTADRSKTAFVLALVTLLAAGLLPTSWLRVTGDIAAVVRVPLAPLSHLGTAGAEILRPAPEPLAELPPSARERVRQLHEERDRFEQLYLAERQRVEELAEQIEQLQLVPVETLHVPVDLLRTSIVARSPNNPLGPVQLRHGERRGVRRGAIAVYRGVHLLGRITDVHAFASTLQPLANPATGRVQTVIVPSDRPDAPADQLPRVILEAVGDGTFLADVARTFDVGEGDVVRLSDPAWPRSAQQMIIGRVESVRVKEQQPLRNRAVIRPRFQVYDVAYVTLILERDESAASATANTGREGGAP